MGPRSSYPYQDCSLARALEAVGERWTLLVVRDLFYGLEHFGDLLAHLDLPPAVLSERLVKLADLGVVEKHVTPSGSKYALTETGVQLWPAIYALAQWGERQFASDGPRRIFSHVACGNDVTPTGWCPTCQTTPGPADLVIRNGPGSDPTIRDDRVSTALRARPHQLLTPVFPNASKNDADKDES